MCACENSSRPQGVDGIDREFVARAYELASAYQINTDAQTALNKLNEVLGAQITTTAQAMEAFKLLNAKILEMDFVLKHPNLPWWWNKTEETAEYIEVEGE
jgi:hypothetical protein